MKHLALYIGLATALVVSCSTKEIDIQAPQQDDVIFYASFEQPGEEGTRVYANEDLFLRWNADDRVSIFNKLTYNQQYKFTGETGDNAGGFKKVDADEFVTGNAISHVVSVYPYQEATKITESESLTLTLPAEQHYAENTFGLGANTMVSVTSDNVLQYKNVGGYLVFKLYGESVSVSSITLKGNNGEKIAGKASVTMPLGGVPSVTMAEDATDEITLTCPEPVALGATAEESKQFWFVVPPITFGEGFTITVKASTGGTFEKSTSKSVTIERNTLSKMSPIEVVSGVTPSVPVPEAVDLGLPSGIKWASFNLGASSPEEYGDYYAWGETEPYYISQDPLTWKEGKENGYSWASYKWCMGAYNTMIKYCNNSSYGYNGFTDDNLVIDPADDAAYVNLGGSWRMPTYDEWTELIENCTWTWTTQNRVKGYRVTGKKTGYTDKSIFLPAAGGRYNTYLGSVGSLGYYWSSSLYSDNPSIAWFVHFGSSHVNRDSYDRYYGQKVRPVYGDASTTSVTGVVLNKTSLSMTVGDTQTLTATISPSNATDKTVTWSSSNISVATVSSSGVVTAKASGSATITVTTNDGGKKATCSVTVKEKTVSVPEAIDLGLSVKWASFNLGASEPEEYGDYYAWGETEPYYISQDPLTWKEGKENGYSWASYKWCMGDYNNMTKYCSYSGSGYNGFTDTKTVLDLEDDAARANWGGTWRMPTYDEWFELWENCTWTWTTQNRVKGYRVTGKKTGYTDKSIFLPAAGNRFSASLYDVGSDGYYWLSSLCTGNPYRAWSVSFYSSNVLGYGLNRSSGLSVRPVTE